jgi:hypothetical protein
VARHQKRDPGGRVGQAGAVGRVVELGGDVLVIEARQPLALALRQLAAQKARDADKLSISVKSNVVV